MKLWDYVTLYRKLGFNLIPLTPSTKRPALKSWLAYQRKLVNEEKLREFFYHAEHSIGVICGSISGDLVVLDCDSNDVFERVLSLLDVKNKTLIVKTPKGGHIYLRSKDIATSLHFVDKLDIKAEGSYVVAPPSVYGDDTRYEFAECSNSETIVEVVGLMERLVALKPIEQAPEVPTKPPMTISELQRLLEATTEGERNINLARVIGHLINQGLDEATAIVLLRPWVIDQWHYPEKEFLATLRSAYRHWYDKDSPKRAPAITGQTFRQIELEPPQPLEVLIDRLLCRGDKMILAGREKSGKSIIAENWAVEASCGAPAGGMLEVPKPLRVAIIDTEIGKQVRRRVLKIAHHKKLNPSDNLLIIDDQKFTIFEDEAIASLISLLKSFRPDITFIDPLYKFVSSNINDQEVATRATNIFDQIIDATGGALVILHHCRKAGAPQFLPDNIFEIIAGSFVFVAWVNCEFLLWRWHTSLNSSGAIIGRHRNPDWAEVGHIFNYDKRTWGINYVEPEDAMLDDKVKRFLGDFIDFGEDQAFDYSAAIRLQIDKYKISAAEWSRLSGLPQRSVQHWVKADRYPRVVERQKIDLALDRIDEYFATKYAADRDFEEWISEPSVAIAQPNGTIDKTTKRMQKIAPKTNRATNDDQNIAEVAQLQNDQKSEMLLNTNISNSKKNNLVKNLQTPQKALVIKACEHCPLKGGAFVDGTGDCANGIMIVGQNPGKDEIAQGKPFVGKSGQLLNDLLSLPEIDKTQCRVTNIVKCHTPDDPTPKMIKCCSKLLDAEIEQYKPKLIIALGRFAFDYFKTGYALAVAHGKRIKLKDYEVVGLYHPAACLRRKATLKLTLDDFEALNTTFAKPIAGDYKLKDANIAFKTTERKFFIAADTETTGLDKNSELIGASFSDGHQTCYVNAEDVKEVFKNNVFLPIIFHNAKFDLHVLASNDIARPSNVDDTMLLAYILNKPSLALKDLAFSELGLIMKRYENIVPKGGTLKDVDKQVLIDYACADADATFRLWNVLFSEMADRFKFVYFNIEKPLIPILVDMERNGVRVDVKYLKTQYNVMTKQITALLKELEAHYGLDQKILNSPKQLGNILFDSGKFDLPKPKFTKSTKQYSTEASVLERLKYEHPVVNDILEYRSVIKLRDTFIKGLLDLQVNGFVYPEWHQTGTTTGRFSCSKPNLQQLPVGVIIRKAIIAPDGYEIAAFDYRQCQLCILAFIAQDKAMLDVFAKGGDMHMQTSRDIFSDEKHRPISRSINFAVAFGASDDKIAEMARESGISVKQARGFIDKYFDLHPDVKRYIDRSHHKALETGYAETYFGRRRVIDDLTSNNPKERAAGLREAFNMEIQGCEADIVKMAMANVSKIAIPYLQIHDELVFVVKQGDDAMVENIKRAMLELDTPFTLAVGVKRGASLGELK